jgi:hypothetical protein
LLLLLLDPDLDLFLDWLLLPDPSLLAFDLLLLLSKGALLTDFDLLLLRPDRALLANLDLLFDMLLLLDPDLDLLLLLFDPDLLLDLLPLLGFLFSSFA